MTANDSPLLDALAQKAARLERCVRRAREEHQAASDFLRDHTRQDAAILNVQRACELALDMGNMVISHEAWGLPRSARDVFATLHERGLIDATHASALQHMVGFRNIAVHEYDELNMEIVESIVRTELDSLQRLAGAILSRFQRNKA